MVTNQREGTLSGMNFLMLPLEIVRASPLKITCETYNNPIAVWLRFPSMSRTSETCFVADRHRCLLFRVQLQVYMLNPTCRLQQNSR